MFGRRSRHSGRCLSQYNKTAALCPDSLAVVKYLQQVQLSSPRVRVVSVQIQHITGSKLERIKQSKVLASQNSLANNLRCGAAIPSIDGDKLSHSMLFARSLATTRDLSELRPIFAYCSDGQSIQAADAHHSNHSHSSHLPNYFPNSLRRSF